MAEPVELMDDDQLQDMRRRLRLCPRIPRTTRYPSHQFNTLSSLYTFPFALSTFLLSLFHSDDISNTKDIKIAHTPSQ